MQDVSYHVLPTEKVNKQMKKILSLLLICFYSFQVFAQDANPRALRGKIVDEFNLPIAKANVKILSNFSETLCQTEQEGNFLCTIDFNESFTLIIEAENFAVLRRKFESTADFSQAGVYKLSPESVREEVVVTANRTETRLGETPASVVTLSETEIETTAAPTIDDALRQTAGFSLFRRTGSRNANPTAQGVSLRGVGASGASRSLVLFDGVPLNDPFGGWVQWNRVAPIAVERVEILRGGASSLYGNNSLSGTINILPKRAREKYAFSAEVFGGTQRSFSGSTFFGFKRNDWSANFVASSFQTKGYILIDESVRGIIDSFAGSRNSNFSVRVGKNFGEKASVFFKPSFFGESRTNGTPAQINRTHIRQFILGGDLGVQGSRFKVQGLRFDWRVYGGTQVYDQTFSAVSSDRNSETLNRLQRVPAQNIGFSGQFSGVIGEKQTIVIGLEAREVRGASDEIGFFNNRATSSSGAGGRERTFGVFVQDFVRIGSKLILTGNARFDSWRNFAALNSTRTLANNQTITTNFADRRETAFSPQVSMLLQATKNLSFFAVASKSFRAPTLNELYRGFRVGNIVTLSNENLRAEKANNFEAGASFAKDKIYIRGNIFWTEISQPIANVTLSATPNLITRQRQNGGTTKARGLEVEAETKVGNFNFSAGYLLVDSRVTEFSANKSLENLFVPQVARHQMTFQTRYAKRAWSFALQGRASSAQFDDDLNLFRLEPYFQLDGFAAKKFKGNWQIFVGVENVFNSSYSVGRTPIRTVSSPLNLRVGVRWN